MPTSHPVTLLRRGAHHAGRGQFAVLEKIDPHDLNQRSLRDAGALVAVQIYLFQGNDRVRWNVGNVNFTGTIAGELNLMTGSYQVRDDRDGRVYFVDAWDIRPAPAEQYER